MSVSYTHLDVYKRQSHGCDRIVTLPYSFPNATQWAIRHGVDYSPIKIDSLSWEKGLESMYEIESFDGAVVYIDYPNNPSGNSQSLLVSGLIPVSYTHLDVYKRQVGTGMGPYCWI